jgi:hypothetical protein
MEPVWRKNGEVRLFVRFCLHQSYCYVTLELSILLVRFEFLYKVCATVVIIFVIVNVSKHGACYSCCSSLLLMLVTFVYSSLSLFDI